MTFDWCSRCVVMCEGILVCVYPTKVSVPLCQVPFFFYDAIAMINNMVIGMVVVLKRVAILIVTITITYVRVCRVCFAAPLCACHALSHTTLGSQLCHPPACTGSGALTCCLAAP